ncbi:MAG: flagellar protein FliT [Hydrogenophilaceae bacterium]|jgi:flagellar protein FliT|nr:flagellar protein FliT [Hydrogenophilaceae bacterium]
MNTIAQYESLSGLLTTMISAAEKGDWDQVAGMESTCKPIIEQIRNTTPEERLTDDERRQKIQVIKQILRDDARLRELASPWMAQLQDVIQQTRKGRDALHAYDNR